MGRHLLVVTIWSPGPHSETGMKWATKKLFRPVNGLVGAARGIRTPDPVITNDVLYQLSYCGFGAVIAGEARIIKEKHLRAKCGQ